MKTMVIEVTTGRQAAVHDLTGACAEFVRDEGDGLLTVFVPHATAGVAVLEVGSGTPEDLLRAIESVLPADDRWRHRHGSPGHGRDHVLPAFVSPSVVVPVVGGRLTLGTWQSVVLVDTNRDNPRRQVRLAFVGG